MPGTINPYNFVPLGTTGPQRSPYPGLRSLRPEAYSGIIQCRLVCLGPLVSVDHRSHETCQLSGHKRPIKVFKFLRNSAGAQIVQGASVKGMVRAVYEAMEDACLVLATTKVVSRKSTTNKIPYNYEPGSYTHDNCNALDKLCPACRLFGAIRGDSLHCQGRVFFSDATLGAGDLVAGRHYLRELSSPKPHHAATYSRNGRDGGEIAGRKFYYHHKQPPAFWVSRENCTERSSAIDEFAPKGTEFSFQVHISDLDARELGGLLLALELERGLGHKLGMGKAIGLGSARIEVDVEKSKVWRPKDRYRTPEPAGKTVLATPDWYGLEGTLDGVRHATLYEVLRINKPDDGEISYPIGTNYPTDRIDARGQFGGSAPTGGYPTLPEAEIGAPTEPPPAVGPGEQAAWLRTLFEKEMVLVTQDNKEVRRQRTQLQGKQSLLSVGQWYVLSGTSSVKSPVKSRDKK